jgi:putative DNA methylase
VLVSSRREDAAPVTSRREFVNALKVELPMALSRLQRSNIAPVDFAQAAIGPGMAVYTRFSRVEDAEGNAVSVGEALQLVNQILDEVLASQEGDFDRDTRWAITWFEDVGLADGEFGKAEQLSKSRNTSVQGLVSAGILQSGRGKVRLLKPAELDSDWDPAADPRLTIWEMTHHLIRVLEAEGETGAAILLAKIGAKAEVARELAYRLYSICERKKRAAEALSYNGLVQAWPEISRLARGLAAAAATPGEPAQTTMDV